MFYWSFEGLHLVMEYKNSDIMNLFLQVMLFLFKKNFIIQYLNFI